MASFEYTLPAIRASQANRDFYVTMCPCGMLSALVRKDPGELPPEIEAMRVVNEDRVPDIARYVLGHRDSYILSAVTAVVDSNVRFELYGDESGPVTSGDLNIPISARLIVLDGRHRCAALADAVRQNPDLANESVPLVIFIDEGFQQSSRLFADLKCNERKAPQSLRIFHSDNDKIAMLTRELIARIPAFDGMIEFSRSTISNRSRKLFTLSALYQANRTLLADRRNADYEENVDTASQFWKEVSAQFPDWTRAKAGKVSPAELRKSSIHVHGIALSAIARAGRTLLARHQKTWRKKLRGLRTIDWSRANVTLWEGRAMIGGRLSKSNSSVVLTGNAIKSRLSIQLTDEEQQIEAKFAAAK